MAWPKSREAQLRYNERVRQRWATDSEFRARRIKSSREGRARNGDRARETEFRSKYGIGFAERDALLEKQGGVCAICGTGEPGRGKAWNLDHDHATGELRGVLCVRCNFMIGHAKDDPAILTAGAAYLRREPTWLIL